VFVRLVIDDGESFGETRDSSCLFDDTVVMLSQDQLRQVSYYLITLCGSDGTECFIIRILLYRSVGLGVHAVLHIRYWLYF